MSILLRNSNVEVELLQTGAAIYQIKTKDKNGEFGNIVLSHKETSEYKTGNDLYAGVTCGRIAGRIENAEFVLDGETYKLEKNFVGKHNLHGGFKSISHMDWDYEVFENINYEGKEATKCVFKINSSHLEKGFPGNVEINTEYILVENELIVNYNGTSDRKTYLNLTNHSYFNLGNADTIKAHSLTLDCDKYVITNSEIIPQKIENVNNTEYDFRETKAFGNLESKEDELLKELLGYDHCFVLNKKSEYDLILQDKESGRVLKIQTTYPSVVMYTYNFPAEAEFVNRKNVQYAAVAIEPQYPPNAMNGELFNLPVVDVDAPYKETIKYIFN